MKKWICLLATVTLAGCSEVERYRYGQIDPDAPINIKAKIESEYRQTRAQGPVSDESLPLSISLFRVDHPYFATYAEGPVDASIAAEKSISTGLFYQSVPTHKSKLIGIHPRITPSDYDDATRTVTYASIDGATDIMVSNLVEGSKESPMTTMTFKHLLTRILVNVQAEANVIEQWGELKSVTLAGKKQDILVHLPDPADTEGEATISTGGEATDLPITKPDGTAFEQIGLTTEKTPVGQAMFAPVASGETLSLTVTTTKGSTTVTAKKQDYAGEASYALNLHFTSKDITLSTVSLNDWGDVEEQTIPL